MIAADRHQLTTFRGRLRPAPNITGHTQIMRRRADHTARYMGHRLS